MRRGGGAVAGCIRHGLRLLLATSALQYTGSHVNTRRLPNAFSVHSVNRDRFTLWIHFAELNLDVVDPVPRKLGGPFDMLVGFSSSR